MKKSIKVASLIFIGLLVSFLLSVFWWRAWMYQGFIGPIPFLHWFIVCDGEACYDLTELEIIFHILLALLGALLIYKKIKRKGITSEA
jgi:hypothetical protein